MTQEPKLRTTIYARMSIDHTGQALGVERQLEDCRKLAEARGWAVTREIVENSVSASKGKRAGFMELLRLMESGSVDVVVVWHMDRLLRQMTDLEKLISIVERTNTRIATVTGDIDLSTDTGRMVGRILASVARAEVERKSARQQRANLQRAEQGLPHITHRPFGYEPDCMTLRVDEVEALQLIAKLTMDGYSYQEVAYQLNERGYRTSRGKLFFNLTVRKLLTNKRYAGIREYEGQDYPAQWPAVYTEDEWQQLQLIVRMRREAAQRPQIAPRKFLLTGLIVCGRCGKHMAGATTRHSRDGKVRRVYHCMRQGRTERRYGCSISRNADAIEEFVRQLVVFRLDSPALGRLLSKEGSDGSHLRELLHQRKAKTDRKTALADDYADGTLTKDEYTRQKQRIDLAVAAIDKELAEVQRDQARIDLNPGQRIEEAWAANSDGWRRQLTDLLVDRIVVNPTDARSVKKADYFEGGDGRRHRFNPADVRVEWRI